MLFHWMTRLQAIGHSVFVAVVSFDDIVTIDESFCCLSVLALAVAAAFLSLECACAYSLCSHGVDVLGVW